MTDQPVLINNQPRFDHSLVGRGQARRHRYEKISWGDACARWQVPGREPARTREGAKRARRITTVGRQYNETS